MPLFPRLAARCDALFAATAVEHPTLQLRRTLYSREEAIKGMDQRYGSSAKNLHSVVTLLGK